MASGRRHQQKTTKKKNKRMKSRNKIDRERQRERQTEGGKTREVSCKKKKKKHVLFSALQASVRNEHDLYFCLLRKMPLLLLMENVHAAADDHRQAFHELVDEDLPAAFPGLVVVDHSSPLSPPVFFLSPPYHFH